jgi:hypothetical protein
MSDIKAFPPLPIANVSFGKPGYVDWAFNVPDAEGMPGAGLNRYHGAVDWFASGGEPVKAARAGQVVEMKPSRGTTGQIFGGVVKVEETPGGPVWVYRHVDPSVRLGEHVAVRQVIGKVTAWRDGPPHLHMEIWRTFAGGYQFANAIDPKSYLFTVVYGGEPPGGNGLRLGVNGRVWRGWEEAGPALEWIARHGLKRSTHAFLTWQGTRYDGPRKVRGVARNLTRRFLS